MAFWGIEVKPGKPFTHHFDGARGRLRISQATLGIGSAMKSSLLQCNLGDKRPVFACALLPDKIECCHLELEFEEAEEVIFSVIGPRSVHLTGYYVGNCRSANINDDTESFGEDIANTESGESVRCSDEDNYDDSFINDSDPEILTPSPIPSDRVLDDEMFDEKKPKDKKRRLKRLKKKYQQVESDDNNSSRQQNVVNGSRCISEPESEDEDKFPISLLCKSKTNVKDTILEVQEKADNGTAEMVNRKIEDNDTHVSESERKTDAGVVAGDPGRGATDAAHGCAPTSSEGKPCNSAKLTKKRQEQFNDVKTLEADIAGCITAVNEDKLQRDEALMESKSQDLHVRNEGDRKRRTNDGESLTKSRRKRKERSEEKITVEADQNKHINVLKEDKIEKVEAESLPSAEVGPEGSPKQKKRRRKGPEDGKSFEAGIVVHNHVLNEDQTKQDELEPDGVKDLSAQNEEESRSPDDKSMDVDSSQLASGCQSKEKKKKKKKSKIAENDTVNIEGPLLSKEENVESSMKMEDKNVDANSYQSRTLSNGLIIEEIEKGNPDGKMAVNGKKIKVRYVGMLRDSGKVFDSNLGEGPFRFQLGADDVIEGWNVGLDGMRVGGKRRLTVSPSMGYGSRGAGENIPPNSWLVYEVELLGVR